METPKRREARGWLAMEGSLTVEQLPLTFLSRQPPIDTRAATRGSRRRSTCRHRCGPAPQTPAARVPGGPVVGGDDLVRGYGLRRDEAELERREACWSRAGDPQFEDALGRVARRPKGLQWPVRRSGVRKCTLGPQRGQAGSRRCRHLVRRELKPAERPRRPSSAESSHLVGSKPSAALDALCAVGPSGSTALAEAMLRRRRP
jgi:hypothetical protein